MVVSRRILIRVAVAVFVLAVIAFPLGDSHHGIANHHAFLGAVGNVFFAAFLLSLLLLIVLGVVALVQSLRSATR
jgi:uncharacterized metal-binding protein